MKVGGTDGNGLYGRQTLRGNLAYGGGPHEWLDPAGAVASRPSTPLLQYIGKRLFELYPKLGHVRMIRSWAGVVENTPDGRPILDHLPGLENATFCTMSAVGFGLSPATGRAMSEIVLDGGCSFADISSFRFSRFSKIEINWAENQGWVSHAKASEHA
jgi:sarcosine oxidase subunit beta